MTQRRPWFVHRLDKLCDRRGTEARGGARVGYGGNGAGHSGRDGWVVGSESGVFRALLRSGGAPYGTAPSELTRTQLCSYFIGVWDGSAWTDALAGRKPRVRAGSLRGETS
ncbi:hypothetical protein BN2537_8313 [Streptomyces venezuelae]|nr:hypothetical protein BN2537_8313 [Streptomyces venezuelae]